MMEPLSEPLPRIKPTRADTSVGFAAVVTAPTFVAPLVVLLLNDLVLKHEFANALTGKLSDLAGLWLFPAFFASMFPRRRAHIYVLTGAGFIFWKSALSTTAIAAWNALPLLDIGRVVDWTDLVALGVLPLSYAWFKRPRDERRHRARLAIPLAGASVFAFAATTCAPEVERTETFDPSERPYTFGVAKSVLIAELGEIDGYERRYSEPATPFFAFTYDIYLTDVDGCTGEGAAIEGLTFRADFLDVGTSQSEVRLRSAEIACDDDYTAAELRSIFEREVIDELRAE